MTQQFSVFITPEKLAALRTEYSDALFLESDTVYAIPSLALKTITPGTLFKKSQLEAEREFTNDCEKCRCIGFRSDLPIKYLHLTSKGPNLEPDAIQGLSWSRGEVMRFKAMSKKLDPRRTRLLGVVGRLLTAPPFLVETEVPKNEFEKLAIADRTSWPLQRPIRGGFPTVVSDAVESKVSDFVDHLKAHLDRWGLMKLAD